MPLLWHVLRVKPHKEKGVHQLLQEREFGVYFPVLKVTPKNPRSAKSRPYFPGYLFVQADLEVLGRNALSWLPGTNGLVSFGGEPAVVSPHLLQELKRRLAEIEASGGLNLDKLKKGDRVRIVDGPFEGYEAIFDVRLSGKQRVQVLLSFLSDQPQPVQLSASDIERIKP